MRERAYRGRGGRELAPDIGVPRRVTSGVEHGAWGTGGGDCRNGDGGCGVGAALGRTARGEARGRWSGTNRHAERERARERESKRGEKRDREIVCV